MDPPVPFLLLEAQLIVVIAAAVRVLVVVGRASFIPVLAYFPFSLLLGLVADAVLRLVLTCKRDERSVQAS